ncbi:MAG: LamG domain-containing protein [Polyangiaceae bacterium]
MRLAFFALFLAAPGCSLDWDRLDPEMGSGGPTSATTGDGGATSVGGMGGAGVGAGGNGGNGGMGGSGGGVGGRPPSYADIIVADAPIAYWRLGERSGTTVMDMVGSAHGVVEDGVTVGVPGLVATSGDTAFEFDVGRVNVGTGFEFPATSFSLELWLRTDVINGGFDRILDGKWANADGTQGWDLHIQDTQGLTFEMVRDTQFSGAHTFIPANEILHVVATFDGTVQRLYVDGMLVDIDTTPVVLADGSDELLIGGRTSQPFDGVLDDVSLWDRPLSADEVAAHFAAGSR